MQYDDEEERYEVIFVLKDSSEEYVKANGTATIRITYDIDLDIYEETHSFSSSNFSEWTNRYRDTSRLLCCITIPISDLEDAASQDETLYLTVNGDSYNFDTQLVSIGDLPQKDATINLPSVPATYTDYSKERYYTSVVTVQEITFESNIRSDGSMTVTFNFLISLDEKPQKRMLRLEFMFGIN